MMRFSANILHSCVASPSFWLKLQLRTHLVFLFFIQTWNTDSDGIDITIMTTAASMSV